jgi:hypothetical protein
VKDKTLITYCPSCGVLRQFVCIGYQEGFKGPGFFMWNCSEGHTLSGNNIGKTALDFKKGDKE